MMQGHEMTGNGREVQVNMKQDERMRVTDPRRLLFELSVPAIAAQIVTLLYNTVDRIYIGRMAEGTLAMAGVGVCMPITMLLTAFSNLFCRGGSPLAAISLGKEDYDGAERYLGNSFTMLIGSSLAIMAVVFGFRDQMLYMFGATDNTFPFASAYLTVYTFGTVFVQITLGMNYYITTQGFARTAMVTTMLGAVLNIALDPVFMFTMKLGVKGAALATVVSQLISCIFVLHFLFGSRSKLRIKGRNLKLDPKTTKEILVLGAAPFFMTSSESVLHICFNMQALKYGGDLAVGAMTILFSMFQFISLPVQGIAQGSQPIVSFNYGAGEYGRVRTTLNTAVLAAFIFSVCGTLSMLAFPEFYIRLFNSDPELVELGARMLRVYIFGCLVIGPNTIYQQTYTSMGDGRLSFFFAFLRKVILLIPFLYLFPNLLSWGIMAVVLAEPVSDILTALCNWMNFGRFINRKLA